MAKKAAYVVWKGRVPGVYRTWPEAEAQVSGFPGAEFRGFTNPNEAERAWKSGNFPNGGNGYVHGAGIACGHGHAQKTRNPDKVTCPACRREMAGGSKLAEPPAPKPKPEKVVIVWRLWNLKTGTWASDQRHQTSDALLREKIARVHAAAHRIREFARQALLLVQEHDTTYRERRQSAFDQRYPKTAARRVAQQHEQQCQE